MCIISSRFNTINLSTLSTNLIMEYFSLQISWPILEIVLISSHNESLKCYEERQPWTNVK
jgi:hypothetical protein